MEVVVIWSKVSKDNLCFLNILLMFFVMFISLSEYEMSIVNVLIEIEIFLVSWKCNNWCIIVKEIWRFVSWKLRIVFLC